MTHWDLGFELDQVGIGEGFGPPAPISLHLFPIRMLN